MFRTARSGIWVGLLVTSLGEPRWNTQETLTELRWLSKHFWVICDSYFIETEQDFSVKELYHLALQFGVYLRFGRLRCIFLFFLFEVRVASGDCRVVIFARIRIDNLLVHLGYSSTSNGSGVHLQLLKSYKNASGHEESVYWLLGTCRFRSVPRNASENATQSWSTSAYFAKSMIEYSFNMRDKQSFRQIVSKG